MIQLTRLNRQPLIVNSDLIAFIENAPDTVITLITGEKVVVLESTDQIIDQVVRFRQRVVAPFPTPVTTIAALSSAIDKPNDLE